jgi:hypothetical protein
LDERWSDSDYSEGGTDRIVDELDTEYEGIRIVKDDFTWAWWYTPTVPATQEAETRGSLESRISGHPGQHGKTLSQKQSKTYKKRISVVKYENIHRKIILLL